MRQFFYATALKAEQFLAEKANGDITRLRPPWKIGLANEIMGQSLGRLPLITRKGHLVLSYEKVEKGLDLRFPLFYVDKTNNHIYSSARRMSMVSWMVKQ
ncbi:unnamed protein product [Clonostachys rhizophaga]|uniref:Uncharacterized protein n=1 Tax=Clonostachys rhizophaga TaxID=160324 RepID=A0A9N9YQ60_9HYPO|nr:unnamed protein product [Clonostachys rhizophaga]